MMMRCTGLVWVAAALLAVSLTTVGQQYRAGGNETPNDPVPSAAGQVCLFSYFKGNGEDGLHLAYSDDGLVWHALNGDKSLLRPEAGKDKLMRDPQISFGPDGLFHMVWTTSWTDPVIGHATSKDLISWSAQQSIAPMTNEPNTQNVWAPELFYDDKTRAYILFWSSTIPGRFPETDKSGDSGRNHRIYFVTTKDFRTFTTARLFYDPGFSVIDATIVADGQRYVMFFKDETRWPVAQKNIHFAVSKQADGPYGPPAPQITGDYWAEGPSAIKLGGRWIVYFDRYRDHRYGAVASADWRHWEDISDKLQFPEGARHGTSLLVPRAIVNRLLELKQ